MASSFLTNKTPFLYLHQCARLSADYLHDDLTKRVIIDCQILLSSAAQIQLCEYHTDMTRKIVMHPWVEWMLESVEHYTWCVCYYESLCDKSKRLFYKEITAWRFIKALKDTARTFPTTVWVDPPLPEDLNEALQIMEDTTYETYRNYYLMHYVKLGCYRRVEIPHWILRKYETTLVPPEKPLSERIENDATYIDRLVSESD